MGRRPDGDPTPQAAVGPPAALSDSGDQVCGAIGMAGHGEGGGGAAQAGLPNPPSAMNRKKCSSSHRRRGRGAGGGGGQGGKQGCLIWGQPNISVRLQKL